MAKKQAEPNVAVQDPPTASEGTPTVHWDDSQMSTSFANVVNGASTREEVTLFFGTNRTWNLNGSNDIKVQLSDRIILTPYAAKRLWLLMGNILKQYEGRFGPLDLDSGNKP